MAIGRLSRILRSGTSLSSSLEGSRVVLKTNCTSKERTGAHQYPVLVLDLAAERLCLDLRQRVDPAQHLAVLIGAYGNLFPHT